MLRFLWNATKGHHLAPWRSPYLLWRIETYTGVKMTQIGFLEFWEFVGGSAITVAVSEVDGRDGTVRPSETEEFVKICSLRASCDLTFAGCPRSKASNPG